MSDEQLEEAISTLIHVAFNERKDVEELLQPHLQKDKDHFSFYFAQKCAVQAATMIEQNKEDFKLISALLFQAIVSLDDQHIHFALDYFKHNLINKCPDFGKSDGELGLNIPTQLMLRDVLVDPIAVIKAASGSKLKM